MYSDNGKISIINDPRQNYKKGYIKLYRSIENHWLSAEPHYYLAFIKILLKVNHKDNSILIENELIECKRGQALYSLNSWVDIFNHNLKKRFWSIRRVRTFFKLLKNDCIIELKGMRKTTRVTVCNYDVYQNQRQTDDTQTTGKRQANDTQTTSTKELKELNNDKNDKKYLDTKNNFELFWNHYHENINQPKAKKEPSFKHWKKLNITEQRTAYKQIIPYSRSKPKNEHEYLCIARTYLSDKLFNDEFAAAKQEIDIKKIANELEQEWKQK